MIDLSQHKLELNYPCEWVYKVIGANDEDIQNAVRDYADAHALPILIEKEIFGIE